MPLLVFDPEFLKQDSNQDEDFGVDNTTSSRVAINLLLGFLVLQIPTNSLLLKADVVWRCYCVCASALRSAAFQSIKSFQVAEAFYTLKNELQLPNKLATAHQLSLNNLPLQLLSFQT